MKNRNYASSCREKKDEEISGLERLKGQEVFDQNMHFWFSISSDSEIMTQTMHVLEQLNE